MASLGLFPLLGLCGAVPGWACPSLQRGAAAPEDPLRFLGSPTQERKAVGPTDSLGGTVCRGGGLASGCHPLPRLGPTWLGDQCSPGGRKPTRLGSPARERAAIDSRASALPRPRSAVPAATPRTRALPGAILLPAASCCAPAPPAHSCAPGTPSPRRLGPHAAPAALVPLLSTLASPWLLSSAHSVRARASASSALIPPGLSAACGLAWLCREVGP